tara:strand:- start:488 stop:1474 length:987 start_codon:yes stop_codon:yes gene_type:complete
MSNDLIDNLKVELNRVNSENDLMNLKSNYLGKKGEITKLAANIKNLSVEEKKEVGSKLNSLKKEAEFLISEKFKSIKNEIINKKLESEKIDITLPQRESNSGSIHPITQILDEVLDIFEGYGFQIVEGPEIENDYYNFEALNIPKDHPARDMQDTFYLEDEKVLRTHTSPMQVRIMENNEPPIKIISPGKVYRCDSDVTHTPMFHQVEGLLVNNDISFSNLKSILNSFCSDFFGSEVKTRFRPSYFPFTEPSAELDIEWVNKAGEKRWMEVLGCGIVNPKVFEFAKYDSNEVSGFAFGMGIERLAMIKLGITDIRYFYQNDLKFLKQF